MKKIILLDDELKIQMQIYLALCDSYHVEIAEDIASVMYLLRKVNPDILLLDFHFSHFENDGKTGIDFIEKVKRKYARLKIMTILDGDEKSLAQRIQEKGADEIIFKPLKNRYLISKVKKLSVKVKETQDVLNP